MARLRLHGGTYLSSLINMAKAKSQASEDIKVGFSAFRPGMENTMGTISDLLLRRLGLTLNLSVQHFQGPLYRRPHIRHFSGALTSHLVEEHSVHLLSSIALGAAQADPGILESRSIKLAGVERRQHVSGSYYLCASPDSHSTNQLNEERRLLLKTAAASSQKSAHGLLAAHEYELTFARVGTKAEPASLDDVAVAHAIVAEHCPERVTLEPLFFQTRSNEIFAVKDLVDHADAAGIDPVPMYPHG